MSQNTELPLLLIVDDSPANIAIINEVAKPFWRTRIATTGKKALELAVLEPKPNLVLLDVVLPDMDGYDICQALKANLDTRDIPVVFLTAKSEEQDEALGLALGAVDYIAKPFSPPIVEARIRNHLMLQEARALLKNQNAHLEKKVAERTHELSQVRDATIMALASLAETRDNETGNHIRRTQGFVRVLALKLKSHPRFAVHLDDESVELLYKSAPLHDIGKVGIPDAILLKPGPLSPDEFEVMKRHTLIGRDALLAAESKLDKANSFLALARDIALSHHEKWDGTGYPMGLAGEAIPLSARLMALADVYDALISKRTYKQPFTHEKSIAIIAEGKGRHFDPDATGAFLAIADDIKSIARTFSDSESEQA
ncbi:MAG: two-component system response regulator [Rhodospirillales bacterium]|nr:two-component system response regulator [Rhodospirillales bacterium]